MKKILGMGNALTDILFQINDDQVLQELNLAKGAMQLINNEQSERIKAHLNNNSPIMARGGSASNTMNALAKLGIESGFIGKVSDDSIGQFFSKNCLVNGVTPHLTQSNTPSGHCTVLVSPDTERTMCTYLGAAAELLASDLTPEMFEGYDYFHIEGYLVQNHELIRTALQMAKNAGLITSIDLASYNVVEENLDFLREIITAYVDICFANEEEAKAFTQKEPLQAAAEIAQMCDIAVVKVGKEGSYIQQGDAVYTIRPRLTTAVDTTAAGDFYAAGFLYGHANDYSLDICGSIASLVSSKVVEIVGTELSENSWINIRNIINELNC